MGILYIHSFPGGIFLFTDHQRFCQAVTDSLDLSPQVPDFCNVDSSFRSRLSLRVVICGPITNLVQGSEAYLALYRTVSPPHSLVPSVIVEQQQRCQKQAFPGRQLHVQALQFNSPNSHQSKVHICGIVVELVRFHQYGAGSNVKQPVMKGRGFGGAVDVENCHLDQQKCNVGP